jgi:dTDP-4-amino-4,6-dideoxygalactose transaminase
VRQELLQAFEEVLDSGVYISGPRVARFETSFAKSTGSSYAVACNSGTSALILALEAAGVKPGDEIMVPGMTFIATIEAVVAIGAVPVLIDVDPSTWNLDVELAKEKLSSKTKGMIFVHLHGNPSGILDAKSFCEENNLILIEDAAQAHLAQVGNRMVGSFGAAAAFSFYPGKNLGALGEGGCVTTNNPQFCEKAKLVRNWGSKQKYVHEMRGTNYRMDELQAAFLEIKLAELQRWTEKRRELSFIYNKLFDSMSIQRPMTTQGASHSFHIYAIVAEERDALREYLGEKSIETGIHYPDPIIKMKPWSNYFAPGASTPVSERLSESFLSLPLSDQHSVEDMTFVCESIRAFYKN